jgi:6-pyruvoyltetrahydropterin/6-carboxytetrahydropterin synthase
MYGVCNNPHYHGHNYELDVTVSGTISAETGEVMDLGHLRDLVEREIVAVMDHRNLNLEVEWFRDLIPTAENIAVCIWRALRTALPPELALSIRLWETPRNYVDYAGE